MIGCAEAHFMTPQESIAHYRIVSKLGEGGMGVVYRATDTKLNRDVAIKVLPDALANDPDRLARFTREAQVLAALNHPNIAAIYGVEDCALVMELVEGENLKSPLPIETVIAYAKQVAEALEAAHEKGIIHRDLKPANIKVTPQGTIKVLDFGLAAVPQGNAAVSGNPQNSPTLTMLGATQAGLILGTPAYMSPEQAAGKQVDKRSDIWSFGVVLWEMLTGQQLFAAESVSHSLADVLRAAIDFSALPRDTPLEIRTLLARCLDRNVQTRLRDIGEARIALASPRDLPVVQQPTASRRFWLPWAVAAVGIAAAGVLAFIDFRETPPEMGAIRALITPPPNTAFFTSGSTGMIAAPTLSPDGRHMVFGVKDRCLRRRCFHSLAEPQQHRAWRNMEPRRRDFVCGGRKWAHSPHGCVRRNPSPGLGSGRISQFMPVTRENCAVSILNPGPGKKNRLKTGRHTDYTALSVGRSA